MSRARRIVENAFGILASRFRVLLTTINLHPDKAKVIVLAACYLHNYLSRKRPSIYYDGKSVDVENVRRAHIDPGTWRSDAQQATNLQSTQAKNATTTSKEVRRKFCDYFNGEGSVPWQWLHVNGKKYKICTVILLFIKHFRNKKNYSEHSNSVTYFLNASTPVSSISSSYWYDSSSSVNSRFDSAG